MRPPIRHNQPKQGKRQMRISQNIHNATGIELMLSQDRYATLDEDDQPDSDWLDIVVTTDDAEFEFTIFGPPPIKWQGTPDVFEAMTMMRDELDGHIEANADLIHLREVAQDGRRAAEKICDALRAELAGSRRALAAVSEDNDDAESVNGALEFSLRETREARDANDDRAKMLESQLADANAELRTIRGTLDDLEAGGVA